MSFTTQLLKGCVMSDIVNVINRYLVPKNVTIEQIYEMGLVEQLLVYYLNNKQLFNDGNYYITPTQEKNETKHSYELYIL
jgi:hypothetical protein